MYQFDSVTLCTNLCCHLHNFTKSLGASCQHCSVDLITVSFYAQNHLMLHWFIVSLVTLSVNRQNYCMFNQLGLFMPQSTASVDAPNYSISWCPNTPLLLSKSTSQSALVLREPWPSHQINGTCTTFWCTRTSSLDSKWKQVPSKLGGGGELWTKVLVTSLKEAMCNIC